MGPLDPDAGHADIDTGVLCIPSADTYVATGLFYDPAAASLGV